MEADWTVALAAGDPVVTVPWAASGECRFVDLRLTPHRIDEIAEARDKTVLRSALLTLNAPGSLFRTAKCDAWTSSEEDGAAPLDAYEMDASPDEIAFSAGSYIDLLPIEGALRCSFERQERWMRTVIEQLRGTVAKAVRVELVLRPAEVEAEAGFAVTWFVEACGATELEARQRWESAVGLSLMVIMETSANATR